MGLFTLEPLNLSPDKLLYSHTICSVKCVHNESMVYCENSSNQIEEFLCSRSLKLELGAVLFPASSVAREMENGRALSQQHTPSRFLYFSGARGDRISQSGIQMKGKTHPTCVCCEKRESVTTFSSHDFIVPSTA